MILTHFSQEQLHTLKRLIRDPVFTRYLDERINEIHIAMEGETDIDRLRGSMFQLRLLQRLPDHIDESVKQDKPS